VYAVGEITEVDDREGLGGAPSHRADCAAAVLPAEAVSYLAHIKPLLRSPRESCTTMPSLSNLIASIPARPWTSARTQVLAARAEEVFLEMTNTSVDHRATPLPPGTKAPDFEYDIETLLAALERAAASGRGKA
jgi:hypothetical protein